MTKKNNEPDGVDGVKRTVEQIDMSKPFSIIFHQTGARNHIEIFTGENYVAEAVKQANALALHLDRRVAIFGPQIGVKFRVEPAAGNLVLGFDKAKLS